MYSARMLPYEIEPDALATLQNTGATSFVLLDVREPWEYQLAHLHGSVNMPMGDIPSRIHQEIDPDQPIVAVCHHGVRSLNVVAWLRAQGFENSQSLAGGLDTWAQRVDPAFPRY